VNAHLLIAETAVQIALSQTLWQWNALSLTSCFFVCWFTCEWHSDAFHCYFWTGSVLFTIHVVQFTTSAVTLVVFLWRRPDADSLLAGWL